MANLDSYTLDELQAAKAHLEEIEAYAAEQRRRQPDPGWDVVLRMLGRDVTLLEGALAAAKAIA